METNYTFPFGQQVKKLIQQDRSPKKVFVLGVYASAVHARWIAPDNKTTVVAALAVASEPCIFWTGGGAQKEIDQIGIPKEVGKLVAAPTNLNGPSGRSLDKCFLQPLGITRKDAWLCDIVPHSCQNPKQEKAIQREYIPLMKEHGLRDVSLPPVPNPLCDDRRRKEILDELQESGARTLILLGDEPTKWFLNRFDARWNSLGDFGRSGDTYGQKHKVSIGGQSYDVIPLVHPRQASKLGAHSKEWYDLHQGWMMGKEAGLT